MSRHNANLNRIRSFALRQGRFTPAQRHAIQTNWDTYVLPNAPINDWRTVFPDASCVTMDIGFGMGHSLLHSALKHPDHQFIGVEVYLPGIGHLLGALEKHQINHVRLFHGDVVEVLKDCIPDAALDKIQLFFPDPWPKRRHHKRRLVQPELVSLCADKLKSGGIFHMATDWEDYAHHAMKVLSAQPAFQNQSGDHQFASQTGLRALTKYERRGKKLGHDVWDLLFEKR